MKIAIVGSTSLAGNLQAAALIGRLLDLYRPTLVISGGAPGIDTLAEEAALRRGIPVSIHRPRAKGWPYFKERNLKIAEECDHLIRIAASTSKTYGSGWTRDQARKMGKSTEEHVIQL